MQIFSSTFYMWIIFIIYLCAPRGISDIVTRIARDKGIEIILETDITGSENSTDQPDLPATYLVTSDGRKIPYDDVFWCVQVSSRNFPNSSIFIWQCSFIFYVPISRRWIDLQAEASPWLRDSGLHTAEDGSVCVQVR